jgi:hypothetical protein
VCALAVVGVAEALTPANGSYQGTVNGLPTTAGHNEGEGYFKVKSGPKGKIIVPYLPGHKILAPTDFICKAKDPTASNSLQASQIPIEGGEFNYYGIPTGVAGRHIRFKGRWTNATTLVGFTRTTGGGCNHTAYWKMKSPPPP